MGGSPGSVEVTGRRLSARCQPPIVRRDSSPLRLRGSRQGLRPRVEASGVTRVVFTRPSCGPSAPKLRDIERAWHVIDADGAVLGRVATEAATLLRGKHKPIWAPHVDVGDHVVVVNAAKLDVTRAQGRPASCTTATPATRAASRTESLEHLLERDPERVVRLAVKGMLPKSRLGRRMIKKLRVYAGPTHPHAAQQPAGSRTLASEADRARRTRPRKRSRVAQAPDPDDRSPQGGGRRVSGCAPAPGMIAINGRPIEQYFPILTHQVVATEALRVTQTADVYDVDATIDGGGVSGQAGALRLGIARALVALDDELRPALKKAGLLTRDAAGEGAAQVRPQEGPQGAAVLQAVSGRCAGRRRHDAPVRNRRHPWRRQPRPHPRARHRRSAAPPRGSSAPSRPFVVGRDTRRSGPMLEAALVAGLVRRGRRRRAASGVLPTPGARRLADVRERAGGDDLGEPQPVSRTTA